LPYFLDRQGGRLTIEIHGAWALYFHANIGILDAFISHHLCVYLQVRNPYSPGIVRKLAISGRRSLTLARDFWKLALQRASAPECEFLRTELYSSRPIDSNISVDHYLPWTFVAHDQLWNLLPVLKETNSSKGDSIPADSHLSSLARLHWCAVNLLSDKPHWLSDHVAFLQRDVRQILALDEGSFVEAFLSRLKPQVQLARNHGFSSGWEWRARAPAPVSRRSNRSPERNLADPS
jgi:hypothetical protein